MAVDAFGKARFFVLFCLTGIGGFLVSNLLGANPSIGASGAIFGILGALVAFGRRRGGTWGRSVGSSALSWAGFGLLYSLMMPSVNNLAHLGGFATGFALGYLMPFAERSQEARASQVLALLLALGTVASVAMSTQNARRGVASHAAHAAL